MAVDRVRRHGRNWSYIQGSTRNHENERKTNNPGLMLYSVYAVLGVCCTRCMLYSVYVVLDVCCTRSQLMIMAWRDREGWLNFVFCNDGRVVDEKERDGGWRWERCGGYKRIWEIRWTTCLIGLGRPRIGVITPQIGTRTCHIGDGKLTRTRNSLCPCFTWWFAPSLFFSSSTLQSPKNTKLSHPSLSLNAMIKSEHRVQHTPSTAYTEYSIHRVQHTPSTAYTEYSTHWVLHTPHTASSQDWLSPTPSQSLRSQRTMLYSILYIPTITSWTMNRVSAAVAPSSWSTASRSTTSKYSSNLDRSWPPSASSNSLDHGLQLHLWVTRSRPPSASPNSLDHGLQVHLSVSRSQPPSASPNSLNHGLQVHLWVQLDLGLQVHLETHTITASKCIPELLDHGLPVLLQPHSITASKCMSEFNFILASQCISKLALSWPPSASRSYTISTSKCICKLAWSRPPSASLSYTIKASMCIS